MKWKLGLARNSAVYDFCDNVDPRETGGLSLSGKLIAHPASLQTFNSH